MAKQKVVMVDTEVVQAKALEAKVGPMEVTLVNHGINDSIGEHSIYTSFGNFRFLNGKTTVSPEDAKRLKAGGFIL